MIGPRDSQCVSDCIRLFSLDRPNMFSPGTRNHFVFKHVRDSLDSVHVTEDIGWFVTSDQGRRGGDGSCHEFVTPVRPHDSNDEANLLPPVIISQSPRSGE